MNKVKSKLIEDPLKKRDIIGWLNFADDDYISARILIDNGMLIQGAILSATSIEKYLKMIGKIFDVKFIIRGDRHNVRDLYKGHKDNGATFNLNDDYLKFLVKIYQFRYPDKLEADFNFAINQTKLMVALDETVHILRNRIKIFNDKGEEQKNSKIHEMVENNDLRLTRANHTFGSAKREDLFKHPSVWHEVRYVNGKSWMEAVYTAEVGDDENYNLEGLRKGQSEQQFHFQKAPIDLK